MSMFEYRKPLDHPNRNQLEVLEETLKRLEVEPIETARIADLKRILADRIADLKRKTA